jgi:hypothetical protein
MGSQFSLRQRNPQSSIALSQTVTMGTGDGLTLETEGLDGVVYAPRPLPTTLPAPTPQTSKLCSYRASAVTAPPPLPPAPTSASVTKAPPPPSPSPSLALSTAAPPPLQQKPGHSVCHPLLLKPCFSYIVLRAFRLLSCPLLLRHRLLPPPLPLLPPPQRRPPRAAHDRSPSKCHHKTAMF